MFFLIIFILLMIFSFTAIIKKQRYNVAFMVIAVFLTILAMYRYSLGTDYFAYKFIYQEMPLNLEAAIISPGHSESGFKLLISIAKNLGMSYEVFVGVIALFCSGLIYKTIYKYSKLPIVSIFIFFTFYYLIYVFSVLRQGIAQSIIFYSFFHHYLEGKHKKFILAVLISATIHKYSLIFILLFLFLSFENKIMTSKYKVTIMAFVFLMIGFIISLVDINTVLLPLVDGETYLSESVNWLSFFSKIVQFIIIFLIFYRTKSTKDDVFLRKIFTVYTFGFFIYLAMISTPITSRLQDYFNIFELILIPNLLYYKVNVKMRISYLLVISLVLFVLFIKDINSFTIQEKYYSDNWLEYRYFNVFDKEQIQLYKAPHRLQPFLYDQ